MGKKKRNKSGKGRFKRDPWRAIEDRISMYGDKSLEKVEIISLTVSDRLRRNVVEWSDLVTLSGVAKGAQLFCNMGIFRDRKELADEALKVIGKAQKQFKQNGQIKLEGPEGFVMRECTVLHNEQVARASVAQVNMVLEKIQKLAGVKNE